MQRRITQSDLTFGQPLPWEVMDASGQTVLRQGEIVQDTSQLERQLQSGLYIQTGTDATRSVLHELNQIDKRLERIFACLPDKQGAEEELRDIASQLIASTMLNPDIAIACILLNQIGGNYAVRHCIETAILATLVAQSLGQSDADQLCIACATLTMNLGMLRHQDQLQSQRNMLSSDDTLIIRQHPEESANLLRNAGVEDGDWLAYVLAHHEAEDGSGYPAGKCGDDIPFGAKIIALADRYCAFVSARNYRKSKLPDQALEETFFNPRQTVAPELAQAFARQLGAFPPGSFVRLKNGEVGVVSQRARGENAIIVHVLISPSGIPLLPNPIARQADGPLFQIREALHEDEANIRFGMKQVWGPQAAL